LRGRYAFRFGRPWTAAEDAIALAAEPGDLKRVAASLGRTRPALLARRAELRRRQIAALIPSLEAPVWVGIE